MAGYVFREGDRVTWTRIVPAGYHPADSVAAVFRKQGPKRVQIEVKVREPYGRHKPWQSQLKWVEPSSLEPRLLPCAAFAEMMEVEVEGFRLTGQRHSSPGPAHHPEIWYGAVDGDTFGAPCRSEGRALADAYHGLLNGTYRVGLLSSIHSREGWLSQEGKAADEARRDLPALRARLAALDAAFPEQQHFCCQTGPYYGVLMDCSPESMSFLRSIDGVCIGHVDNDHPALCHVRLRADAFERVQEFPADFQFVSLAKDQDRQFGFRVAAMSDTALAAELGYQNWRLNSTDPNDKPDYRDREVTRALRDALAEEIARRNTPESAASHAEADCCPDPA